MKIRHIRNATMVIEVNDKVILVDPMINPMGTMPPFTLFRFKPKRNPTVPLPENCKQTLERVTHCLITHRHPDHIDTEGVKYLVDSIVVF
ncbi:MBL fold metallo-hydrolase [Chloroflexi bacterium TSY]|nr:MBL fold metallo-hydrolase [Candidatus Entotheonella palauensis]MBV7335066.1 MBL fold metallo-hydrolase [Chloroflexi bacterium TSY]